jgi:hypothetical protein
LSIEAGHGQQRYRPARFGRRAVRRRGSCGGAKRWEDEC